MKHCIGFIRVSFVAIAAFCGVIQAQITAPQLLSLAEAGMTDSVKQILPDLLQQKPVNPEYLFVDAVLTEQAGTAFNKFSAIVNEYPKSRYADAALYRIHQYYYALGSYKKADSVLTLLKKTYPSSPYIAYGASRTDSVVNPVQVEQVAGKKIPPAGAWQVQAGAFVKKENAEALKKRLAAGGLTFIIKEKDAAGAVLYIVTTATVSEENAKAIAEKLESNYKMTARVLKSNTEQE